MGAGKSSLVEFLTHYFDAVPFYEPHKLNPYLSDFYKDMKSWGFHSQLFFLKEKFKLHLQINSTEGVVVLDRTIYEDAEIFARNLYNMGYMEKRDFEVYFDLYNSLLKTLRPPDLLIQLKCPLKTIVKRIKMRGRPEEQQIQRNYLLRLQRLYQSWFRRYDLSPVLVIDTSKIDFVRDLVGRIDTMRLLEKYLK